MEHVVFYPAHDGSPAFRRVATLEEAVRLVEHLRNVEDVAEASVHSLAEVPLAFRAYYKVELPGLEAVPTPQVESLAEESFLDVPEQPGEREEEDVPESVPALAAGNGRSADGPSDMGFFVS